MAPGSPSPSPAPPTPLLPPRGRRVHPLRWPIIILTFPFSLLAFVLQSLFGWLPSSNLLTPRRLRRLFIIVAVVWLALGQLTMLFDRDSAVVEHHPEVLRSWPFIPATADEPAGIYWVPSWSCSLVLRQEADIPFGGWPLGRPFMFLTTCSAQLGTSMLRSIGLNAWAESWEGLSTTTLNDWLYHGRMGMAYLLLGLGAFAELVLVFPWLIYVVVFNIVTRLRWDS